MRTNGHRPKGKVNLSNSRIFNAFALTARKDNAQLHPGCRCALPWAVRFCAFSACYYGRRSEG